MEYRVVLDLIRHETQEIYVDADNEHDAENKASSYAMKDFDYDDYRVEEIEEAGI